MMKLTDLYQMANEEHLALHRGGVKVWNEWREKNPKIIPDLSGANLRGANLIQADLSGANLRGANLIQADLSGANLRGANLRGVDFRGANFKGANLRGANLSDMDLRGVNLSGSDLREAILKKTNLSEAFLKKADLTEADLSEAFFKKADLTEANLDKAKLINANLIGANLNGSFLKEADLSGVDLGRASLNAAILWSTNLSQANLSGAVLFGSSALQTNFTGATFTGACIEDWNINSETNLENVICDYVYLKGNQQKRRPHDENKNFALGEFTKIFQKTLETVDLILRTGVDWDAFAYSFKKVEVENSGAQLDVQSIEKKGDGVLVVRVSISPNADKEKIHGDFMRSYESAHKALEAQYQARLEDKDKHINQLFYLLNQSNEKLGEVPKLMVENSKGDMIFHGPVGNAAGEVQGDQKTIQHNYAPEQKQTLAEAAAEIQQLLEQLEKTNPTATEVEKLTVVAKAAEEIKNNPTLKARVIGAIKSGGTEAFKEAVDNPLVNILVAIIEGWTKAE